MGIFSRWFKAKPPVLRLPAPETPLPTYEPALPPPQRSDFERERFSRPMMAKKAHIIVFANEKGGVGKSTTAFHTCVALCNAGETVAALDLDLRQRTLGRAMDAREDTARHYGVTLPGPRHVVLNQANEAGLEAEIRMAQIDCGFVIIDVGGHDSPIARRAIFMADTIVTPVNDSFIDLDMLGHIDIHTGEFKTLGPFARLVEHLKEPGLGHRARPLDWVVMQNRSRSLASKNERKFLDALRAIAPPAGFRLIPGLRERVIYRELFPLGLTLFDLKFIPSLGRAQPAALKELAEMLAALQLPSQTTLKSDAFYAGEG
ncbi:MAG: division plane positioning ATPase MipZ [Sphingomonadaceae bacterium]